MDSGRAPDLVVWRSAVDRNWSETLRTLKAWVRPSFLPVVLLAPRTDVDSRVAGLRAGADDVVGRPWQSAEVVARIAALLRIKSGQEVLEQEKLELERQSITDPLTGLLNRRYFQFQMQQEVERCRRYHEPLSLLVIDLDHFKLVNDRYGHRAGDEALRAVAGILSQELRRLDVCTRWGGEEFAVIMPKTDQAGGAVVARRILAALRAKASIMAMPLAKAKARAEVVRITASLGLASYPAAGIGDADALIQSADTAMYRAKNAGRDRVCVAGELDEEWTPGRVLPLVSTLATVQ